MIGSCFPWLSHQDPQEISGVNSQYIGARVHNSEIIVVCVDNTNISPRSIARKSHLQFSGDFIKLLGSSFKVLPRPIFELLSCYNSDVIIRIMLVNEKLSENAVI
jgi:hypothetical protein